MREHACVQHTAPLQPQLILHVISKKKTKKKHLFTSVDLSEADLAKILTSTFSQDLFVLQRIDSSLFNVRQEAWRQTGSTFHAEVLIAALLAAYL